MKSSFPNATYDTNAGVSKILFNSKRREIENLHKKKALAIEELVRIPKLPNVAISEQASLLRHVRLVTVRRNDLNAYYKITDPSIVEPCRVLHDHSKRNSHL